MIYIETGSTDACFNFAVEDYVIRERTWDDTVFLFWRTSPTLMVGSYQNIYAEVNVAYAKEHGITIVRRKSGGGTIYTDENGWQFSYFYPNASGRDADFAESAADVVEALKSLGVPAEFNGRNDVVAGGRKISGNARYVCPNGVLHHGSLLFDTDVEEMVRAISLSKDKVVSKGIQSVRQRVANIAEFLTVPMTTDEFKQKMLALLRKPGDRIVELTPEERAHIETIADEKFRNWEWNYANGPKFGVSRRRKYPGGLLECCINVHEGRITELELRGDFFAAASPARITDALTNLRYERRELAAALETIDVSGILFRISRSELLDCLID